MSKCSTVALLCYFLSRWCYFSFLVMKGASSCAAHGATATVTCATAKSSLDTPVEILVHTLDTPLKNAFQYPVYKQIRKVTVMQLVRDHDRHLEHYFKESLQFSRGNIDNKKLPDHYYK